MSDLEVSLVELDPEDLESYADYIEDFEGDQCNA